MTALPRNKQEKRFQQLYQSLMVDGKLIYAGTLLYRAAQQWPDRIALICEGVSVSYGELYQHSVFITRKLLALDIKPGDRIVILFENSINFYRAYYGAWQTGAVVVPMNIFLNQREFQHVILDAQPTAIIVSDHLREKLESVALEHTIPLLTEADIAYAQFSNNGANDVLSFTPLAREPDDLAVLLYTSGTTGMPKGVMLSSRNILTNCAQGAALFLITDRERAYAALPLFHSYMQNTCVWTATMVGATTIIVPKISRHALLNGLAEKPTILLGIPALYGLFALFKNLDFNSVRYCISGGDALPNKIRKIFELLYRRKICNGYGLTEASPFVAGELDDILEPTSNVGYPLVGIQCSIRTEDEHEAPRGTIGTLWIKGDNVMLGYYNAPQATAGILKDGWLNTGDLAMLNREGKIILSGREKDLISNKGLKIYPQEVENVLMTHPDVRQVGVVGLKKNNEEIVVAYVATPHPSSQLENELGELARRNLATYKVPRQFILRTDLPTTATGKVDKKQLKTELN